MAHPLPFFPHPGTDIVFLNIKLGAIYPLFISRPKEIAYSRVFPLHTISELFYNNFSLFLLPFFHLGQYGAHIKLQTPDKRHFQDKGPHKIIEDIIGLFLEIHIFVIFQF